MSQGDFFPDAVIMENNPGDKVVVHVLCSFLPCDKEAMLVDRTMKNFFPSISMKKEYSYQWREMLLFLSAVLKTCNAKHRLS